jgi:hypothetical protein
MHFKLIACSVFKHELRLCTSRSGHLIETLFLEKNAHENSGRLRDLIQEQIDEAGHSEPAFDAVLLAYGLCGNATAGLRAGSIPLILPRAHDCCTLFLGSKQAYNKYFADRPSTPFSSAGYMDAEGGSDLHDALFHSNASDGDHFAELVAKYGKENAIYLRDALSASLNTSLGKELIFIEIPELAGLGYAEKCRRSAERHGLNYIQISGDLILLQNLVNGEWHPDHFLIIPPGKTVGGVYDWDEIVRVE